LEFNVPFQHKYGYIRDEYNVISATLNPTQSINVEFLQYHDRWFARKNISEITAFCIEWKVKP